MRFGIAFANLGVGAAPDGAVWLAQLAESLGFESLWAIDHILVPGRFTSRYPYSIDGSGRMPLRGTDDAPDPLLWLAHVGAFTSRIALCSGVLVAPLRDCAQTIRQLATLHTLFGHRVIVGLGAGWLREEFETLDIDFATRFGELDRQLGLIRSAFSNSEHGTVRLIVGGHSEGAADRAARLADGLFIGGFDIDRVPPLVGRLRASAVNAGRDPLELEVTASGALSPEAVEELGKAGVDRVVVPLPNGDRSRIERRLRKFASSVGLT